MTRALLLLVVLASCGVDRFETERPADAAAAPAPRDPISGFGGFGGGAPPDDAGVRPDGAGGFGGQGQWSGGGGTQAYPDAGPGFGGGMGPPPPPDYGPHCNMQNGQACFCNDRQACPGGAACIRHGTGEGFCAASCTPHAFGNLCDLLPGVPGTPECFWNLGDGRWGCAIRCAGGCPAGFRGVDTGGWAGCACVR